MLTLLAAMLLTTGEPAAAALAPRYAGWTRDELSEERRRLEHTRPSLAVPALMITAGAMGIAATLTMWLFDAALSSPPFMLAALAVVSLGLLVSGGVFFGIGKQEIAQLEIELSFVRAALAQQPLPDEARLAVPGFSFVVARF